MAEDKDLIDGFFCPSRILFDTNAMKTPRKSKESKVVIPDTAQGFFDWLAPHYESLQPVIDPTRFQTQSVLLDILNAIEPSPKSILDLGCGTGTLTAQILELLPEAHVYAIDCSIAMLETARENLVDFTDQLTLAKADFRDPWEDVIDRPIDAIVHYTALHNLPHNALREVYTRLIRVLKPGGWFIHGDILEERMPDPVQAIASNIRNFQSESAILDLSNGKELLDRFNEIRDASAKAGRLTETPAMPEQQIAWLTEAGFEFATRVFQDWQVSLFLARKPE